MKYILLFCAALIVSVPMIAQEEEAPKTSEEPPAPAPPSVAPPAIPEKTPVEKPKTEVDKVKHLIAEDHERLTILEGNYKKYIANPRTTNAEKLAVRILRNKLSYKIKVRIAHHNITLQNLENPKPPEPKEKNGDNSKQKQ